MTILEKTLAVMRFAIAVLAVAAMASIWIAVIVSA